MKRLFFLLGAIAAAGACVAVAACGSDATATPPASSDATTSDAPFVPPTSDAGDAPLGDAGSDSADDLGAMGAFCASYAQAICDRRAYCAGQPVPSCASDVLARCHSFARAQIVEALGAGLISFDPARAASCFASSFDDYCETTNLFQLEACQGIFAGNVPRGGACFRVFMFGDLDECKDSVCSVGEVLGTCGAGTCGPFLDGGAVCADEAGAAVAPGCAHGMQCFAGICAPQGKQGDPCTNVTELCRPTWPQLACAPSADGGAGLACDFRRDAGAVCASGGADSPELCRSFVCANGRCADRIADGGLACASPDPPCPTGTACQPHGKNQTPTCQPPLGGASPCANGESCVAGYACATHGDAATCDPLPATGASCADRCAPGLACSHFTDAGACAPIVPSGGACRGVGDDTCAPGLTCNATTKTCAPLAPFGAACAADGDCDRGLYCDDASTTCLTWKRHGASCARDAECVYGAGCAAGHCDSACVIP